MPDKRRANCQECGRHKDECGDISWSGLCNDCGHTRLWENIDGMHTKSGFVYQRYKLGAVTGMFGKDVAAAMFKAGLFTVPLDEIGSKG